MTQVRQTERLPCGRLDLLARDEACVRDALEWVGDLHDKAWHGAASIAFGTRRAWCKAEPLPLRASLRHGMRWWLLRRPAPRLSEFTNLEWLRARCFEAPRPLVAGTLTRNGLIRWQFLIMNEVEDAQSLADVLNDDADECEELLVELAREVARMHALRFIHRDLFPRNFLVRSARSARRLVVLDAWRGGERLQSRGVAHDLACLLSGLTHLVSEERRDTWLEHYIRERTIQGRPVDAQELSEAVSRERAALKRRYRRRGRSAEL